jgi:hypothetical protein
LITPFLKDIEIIENPLYHGNFGYKATAYIAEENDQGADCFHFRILTIKDLEGVLRINNVFNGRATIIVNEYDVSAVEKEIKNILKDCIKPTWEECAREINKYLNWEYDNIQYETLDEAIKRIQEE